MHVLIVGGKLQGLEAVYLAKKAGWRATLIDRRAAVPAAGLADRFFRFDIGCRDQLDSLLEGPDLVIPAFEDSEALQDLAEACLSAGVPIAYDAKAYGLSSSKNASDLLFASMDIPAPRPWPDCRPPLIVKPSESSGSEGVELIAGEADLEKFLGENKGRSEQWVIQEYIPGPAYSLEIIGWRGRYLPLQVTGLEIDDCYDCKRVLAPSDLSHEGREELALMARRIAEKIELNGIMDVEVVAGEGGLKVLEIDARLPSQTPTAVYHSTGLNMLSLLAGCFMRGELETGMLVREKRAVIYEHLAVTSQSVIVQGEHIMAAAGPLSLREGFFGADEALTDYRPGKNDWVATMILTARDHREAQDKRKNVLEAIMAETGAVKYDDPCPLG